MNETGPPNTGTCRGQASPGCFVLASASPRRRALLGRLLKTFTVVASDIDEERLPGEGVERYVCRISRWKAEAVSSERGFSTRDVWVLGADTTVVVEDEMLGKPEDAAQARRMLAQLQDRDHEVITGVCLLNGHRGVCMQDVVRSRVWMRCLTPEEIDIYVASGEPYDKAGGYAIQGLAGRFVSRVEGSYSNVVGLPLASLAEMLREAGIS